MYLFDDPGVLPFGKIVVNQLPFWKTAWQHTPLAACFKQIKDGIENIPQRMFSFAIVS
jgi:hypothetical protein